MTDPFRGMADLPQVTSRPQANDPFANMPDLGGSSDPFSDMKDLGEPSLNTAVGRKQADIANIQENIAKLQAIKPINAEQDARIQAAIRRLKKSLDGGLVYGSESNRSTLDNLTRGITAGVSKGLLLGGADLALLPFNALGIADIVPGVGAFKRSLEEAKQDIQEVTDPEGVAGTVGDFAGTIAGSAPAFGTAAELTGEKIVARFPGSKVGQAIKAATDGGASRLSRTVANVATGAPINIAQGLAAGNREVTEDMSPEERDAIERENKLDKVKNVALGILADALFGFALPGKKTAEGKTEPPVLPPEREAQLNELKTKAERQVAEKAKRDERRKGARSEWAQQNPGKQWKDLPKDERTKVYENYNIKKDAEEIAQQVGFLVDDEAPTATTNPELDKEKADMRKQIVDLNNRLKQEETRRNEVERQAMQDPLMGIGNGRALKNALNRVDTDPNTVWLFFDSNGLKSINDTFGHEAGDKLLLSNRDALIRALKEHGIEVDPNHPGNLFRPSEGGDELVAAVPRDKAQSILAKAEEYSNQQFDNVTGNMSGAIYDTYAEGMSVEGNARLQSRKIASKAKYNIPGRNAEEQSLIDAVRKQISESLADESGAQGPGATPRVEGLEPTSRFAPPSEGVAPVEGLEQSHDPFDRNSPHAKAIDALLGQDKPLPPTQKPSGDGGVTPTQNIGKEIGSIGPRADDAPPFKVDNSQEAQDAANVELFLHDEDNKRVGAWWDGLTLQERKLAFESVGETGFKAESHFADWEKQNFNRGIIQDAYTEAHKGSSHKVDPVEATKNRIDSETKKLSDQELIQLKDELEDRVLDLSENTGKGKQGDPGELAVKMSKLLSVNRVLEKRGLLPKTGTDITPEKHIARQLIKDTTPKSERTKKLESIWNTLPTDIEIDRINYIVDGTPSLAERISKRLRGTPAWKSMVQTLRETFGDKITVYRSGPVDGPFTSVSLNREKAEGFVRFSKQPVRAYQISPEDVEFTGAMGDEELIIRGDKLSPADAPRGATSEPASTEESTRGASEEPTPTEESSTAGTRTGSESQLDGIPKGKPGVTIEAADPPEAGSFIVARDKRGNPIGYLLLEKVEGKVHRAMEVFVDEAHRRKGVATSMYKAAKDAGLDIVSGDFGLSKEGAALVKNLNDKGIVNAVRTTPSDMNVHGDATVPVEVPKPKQTFLESVPHKKPLEELTEKQLDKLDDKIMKAIEKEQPGSEKYLALQRDLDKLMENQRRLNMEAKKGQTEAPVESTDFSAPERGSAPKAIEESNRLLGEHARTLMRKSLRTMNIDDLKLHIDDLQSRLNGMTVMEGKEYRDRLDKALQELAERHKGDQGFSARIPPGVGGAGLGFAYGYMKNPGEDEDRMTNALEWGLIGATAGSLAGRMVRRGTAPRLTIPENRLPAELPGGQWQAEARKTIVHNVEKGKKPIPFLERMRDIYRGIARNTYAAERFQQSLGASRLSHEFNAAKQFGMFGRYTGQTESALRYGPAIYDEFGNAQKLDAKGISDILDMVDGDAESLGDLMAALTTLEQAGKVKNPMPLHVAERLLHAMPEQFHLAAAEARKFSLAMAQVGVDGSLLSPEIVARFATENFYAPMIRIFGLSAEKLKGAEPEKVIAGASTPFKARKGGSTKAVISPFQSMIDMIPRIYRASELNKIKNLWVDAWETAGKPEHLMTRISKDQIKLSGMHEAKIKQIQNELAVSRADAERMVAGLEPTMIDPLSGTMRLYRNGNLESYRIPKELAEAVINLNPEDMHILTKVLGLPSRVAVKGITMHPFFVAKMAFFDMWQATLNSQYGFRFGIDNIRGFLHAATDSKAYRNFLAAGGQHQALYGPSKSNFSTAISDIKAHKGTALGVAFRQARQLKPVEAWKTLVTPISDAARVGEYLRAKDHGASDIEAVYAAKVVTANYNEVGSWGAMRGLQHMTMFLGPAIQVMDQASYRAGIHPFRVPEEGRKAAALNYGLKALVTIALPSWYFWHAYKDDEEINDLRKTQFGSKYWWMRGTDGQVIKIPKPPVDGQIFGTTLEGLLDKYSEGDPHGMDRISGAVLRDAAFNILPTIGVIPYSLETNTNLGLGFPIVPESDQDLALQYQGADKASWLAREVSKKVAPLAAETNSQAIRTGATPAGIDFLINSITGMIGQDVSLGVSQAVEQEQTGYVPAKDEYPIIKRVLVHVPTENVASVQRFYDTAEKVQTAGATVDYMIRHDPDKVMGYAESKKFELAVLPTYAKVRQQIANYHRTITDVKNAPANVISPSDKRLYIEQLTTEIVKLARLVNSYSQQAEAQYKQE